MSITPQEISDKAFSRTFRGYNQEEVDLFLEERLSDYTPDIPKRTVTNEQEQEAINDSIFY